MPARPATRASATSGRQRLLLLALGCALPVAVEILLRSLGFGGAPPLTVAAFPGSVGPAATLRQVNPALAEPFFTRPGRRGETLLGGHRAELVRLPKPEETWRLVLVGDSTAEGFPLPRNLTAASFLAELLREAAVGRQVEVVNLGVTAVASFPVREIGIAALAELEPDLLVVYTGHNEFFGAGGVASWQRMGTRPAVLEAVYALRRSASFQALQAVLPDREAAAPSPAQLIDVMAAVEQVEPGGALHDRASRLLAANVRALAEAARERGVPVVVSTLVSNERDLAPLSSFEENLPAAARPPFRARLAEAAALVKRDPGAALDALAELAAAAPRHAGVAFAMARAKEASGDAAGATLSYRRARDLDAMPWRAASRQNEVLRQVAEGSGAFLADAEARFAAAASPAPGWDLFFDHLHPNLRGQELLAEAVFETIVEHRLLPLSGEPEARRADWRLLAQRLGANPLEHYLLLGKMGAFFERGPLAANNPRAAPRFEAAAQRLLASFDGLERAAVDRWRAASHRVGLFLPISWFGGVAALEAGVSVRAAGYLWSATASAPPLTEERAAATLLEALALARSGAPETAARLGSYLAEAEREAASARPPSAVRLRAHAGLLALARLPERARALDERAEALAGGLSPLAQIYYEALPPAREILAGETSRTLALRAASPSAPQCYVLSLATRGRPGHGASVDLHTAPHRLIGALERLQALAASSPWLRRARITSLVAGPAINVKPAVARAAVEVEIDGAWSLEAIRPGLLAELGSEASSGTLASAACRASGE